MQRLALLTPRQVSLVPLAWGILSLAIAPDADAQAPRRACTPTPIPNREQRKLLHLNLRPTNPGPYWHLEDEESKRLALMLQFVQQRFTAPDSLALLPSLTRTVVRGMRRIFTPGTFGRVDFRAHFDGRITNVKWDSTNASSIDSALVAALRETGEQDQIGTLAFPVDDSDEAPVPAWFDLTLTYTSEPAEQAASHPLAYIRLHDYLFEDALLLPGNSSPSFPASLNSRIEGDVVMSLQIRTDGSVDLEESHVDESSRPEFARAVLDHLPSIRYLPATIGGCPVKSIVSQHFAFRR